LTPLVQLQQGLLACESSLKNLLWVPSLTHSSHRIAFCSTTLERVVTVVVKKEIAHLDFVTAKQKLVKNINDVKIPQI